MNARLGIALFALASVAAAQDAAEAAASTLREALHDSAADFWIYDDVELGYATAARANKPLLISFRCVP